MQIIVCSIILLHIHIVAYETIARYSPSPRVARDAIESSNLYALDLSHNDLSYLCNRTFLELKILEIVNLSLASNKIRCVAQHAFLGLAELERLDLSCNNLTYIHQDTFNHNEKLHWLSLADNKLFTLPSHGVFIYVHSLRFLDLSGCNVTDISHHIFKDMNNIKYLNISHNQIRNIEQGAFHLLKELRCLDISSNNLTTLYNDTYFSSRHLNDYLLSDSSESCLASEAPSSVLKLKADNNPWNCDCEMKGLFHYISEGALGLRKLTCKGPSGYENLPWEVLKEVDCRTTAAPTVTPVSVPTIRPYNAGSVISNVTDKSTVDNTAPVSATSSETTLIIIIIILSIVIVFLVVFIFIHRRKRRRQQRGGNASIPLVPQGTRKTST